MPHPLTPPFFITPIPTLSLAPVSVLSAGTGCYGHTHAARVNGQTGCSGGGTFDAATKDAKHGLHRGGNAHQLRVDQRDKDGWRGVSLEGESWGGRATTKPYIRLLTGTNHLITD